jgi:protease-4
MVERRYLKWAIAMLLIFAALFYASDWYSKYTTRIGIIRVSGVIENSYYAYLAEEVARDEKIKAVIVEVDSVGGLMQPSFRTETAFGELKSKKPLVVLMKDYATSGAYLISTASDYIFAYRDTVTAGIGVIAIWVSYENKWKEEGIDYYVWKSGRMKDLGAPWRAPTEEDSKYMQELVDNTMDELVSRIVRNRPQVADVIDELRDGLTRDGAEAFELELVDELGDYQDALRKAAELAGLREGSYTVVELTS